jgi:hypothetical protein
VTPSGGRIAPAPKANHFVEYLRTFLYYSVDYSYTPYDNLATTCHILKIIKKNTSWARTISSELKTMNKGQTDPKNGSIEVCSLWQAVLWVSQGWEPLPDDDFDALLKPELPTDRAPYNSFVLALRHRAVDAFGTLVCMVQQVKAPRLQSVMTAAQDAISMDKLLETREARIEDYEVRPAPGAWDVRRINFVASYLDLEPHKRVPYRTEWPRIKDMRVSVADLKQEFPRNPMAHAPAGLPTSAPKSAAGVILKATPTLPKSASMTSRRGRKPEYDWALIDSEATRRLEDNPSLSLAELERIMEAWCDLNWPKTPGHTALSDRLRPIRYRHLISANS